MEYVYAAMLLHKAGKAIDESNVSKVLQSAGVEVDSAKVKALVAALSEIDIEEAIKSSPVYMPGTASTPTASPDKAASEAEHKPEEKKEEEEKEQEEALEGLGALFG